MTAEPTEIVDDAGESSGDDTAIVQCRIRATGEGCITGDAAVAMKVNVDRGGGGVIVSNAEPVAVSREDAYSSE